MKNIAFFLLFAAFFSCKKEEDKKPQFPADLYMTHVNKKAGIRLFVNKTEIKDKAIIDKFVKGESNFHVNDSSVVSDEKITFLSKDSVYVGGRSIKDIRSVERNGNRFLFKTVTYNMISKSRAELIFDMNKHRSALTPAYDGNYHVDIIMVGYGDYSKVELSLFSYKVVKRSGQSWSLNTGKTFNEFDESYISTVGPNDTLAIEEYSYTLKVR